jgi:hypothetical protein
LGEVIPDRSSDSEADSCARTDVQLLTAIDLHSARDHAVISAAFADLLRSELDELEQLGSDEKQQPDGS